MCHAAEAHLESRSTECHNPSPCDSWHQMTSKSLSSNSTRNSGGSAWVFMAWADQVGGRSPRLRLPAHTTMLTDGIFLARVQGSWSPSELSLTRCYVDIPDIQGHRPHSWIILLEAASVLVFWMFAHKGVFPQLRRLFSTFVAQLLWVVSTQKMCFIIEFLTHKSINLLQID